jgi:hypothetical protein
MDHQPDRLPDPVMRTDEAIDAVGSRQKVGST